MKSLLSYHILENITEDIYWRGFDYFKKHKVGEIKESDKNLISFVHGSIYQKQNGKFNSNFSQT